MTSALPGAQFGHQRASADPSEQTRDPTGACAGCIAQPDHLRLKSRSDLFTPSGRTRIDVMWDLRVRKLDSGSCELTNTVRSSAPPEMLDFLARQGLALEPFRASRSAHSEAHNRQETPEFAKSIQRHALSRP